MGSSVQASPLIGRSVELAGLERQMKAAGEGLRVVLMLGDPGIGKSRLAREFVSRHSGRALGLTARAYPLGTTAPFGLWVEALERYLRTLGASAVRRLSDPYADDLAMLLPSVAAASPGTRAAGARSRRARLLEGLSALLESLGRRKPVVLVFDDVHLADASSWEAISYVARNASDARALVLLTARPAELGEQTAELEVLRALEQDGILYRSTLGPLDRDDVRALAHETLPHGWGATETLVDWLVDRSRGNPLFALGLLHALVEQGADMSAPRLDEVPGELSERVRDRLRRLDEDALRMLELVVLLARRVELDELAILSARSADRLVDPLEQLVRARLVSEDERGRQITYEVVHPLVQETIFQLVSAARRRMLHRRLARALLAAGKLGEAAAHFARSAEVGDDEAIAALRDAMREAESREAYREALAIADSLVHVIPSGDERWLDVLDALSWEAEWVVDHRADADAAKGVEALREIDALVAQVGNPGRRATVKFRLTSFLAWGTGDLGEAERTCREAVELFAAASDRARTLLARNELAWIKGLNGNFADQEASAAEVAETAEAEQLRFVAMQAHGARAWGALSRGRFAEAEAALERSLAIATEDRKRYRRTWNLVVLALARALAGRIDDAPELLEEAKAGNPAYRESIFLEFRSAIQWMAGDLDGAIETAREVVAWNPAGLSRRRASALIFAALASAETGTFAEGRRTLTRASSVYRGGTWLIFGHYARYADALLAGREGEQENAAEALYRIGAELVAMGALPFAVFPLADAAEVAAEADAADIARDAARSLSEAADPPGCGLQRGIAAYAGAWASLAAGDARTATRQAETAADVLSGSGYGLYEGRAAELVGRARAACDGRDRAVETLQVASRKLDRCGAACRRARVLEELRGLGHRGRKAAAGSLGAEALTRREREVAQLAASGLTARQIGERLFIGERTVETHLAHAYAKLGIRSKLELVRRADELRL